MSNGPRRLRNVDRDWSVSDLPGLLVTLDLAAPKQLGGIRNELEGCGEIAATLAQDDEERVTLALFLGPPPFRHARDETAVGGVLNFEKKRTRVGSDER